MAFIGGMAIQRKSAKHIIAGCKRFQAKRRDYRLRLEYLMK